MDEAAKWYDGQDERVGDAYYRTIRAAVGRIARTPERWPLVDGRHRRLVLTRFPFSIWYRITEVDIYVVAIAHHKRRPAYWSRRR